MHRSQTIQPPPRAARLPACLAAALGLGPLSFVAATAATVTNCNDAGAGSLRGAIAATASGGTVTFSAGLSACTITLTTAAIPITQTNLTIQGPASNAFTVSADQSYRVFNHTGTGTLSIKHLAIENGKYKAANAKGGCIVSAGTVQLDSVTLGNCLAYASSGKARGGGVYAKTAVGIDNTTITSSTAQSVGGAYGGAVSTTVFSASYSTITGAFAQPPGGLLPNDFTHFFGGGVFASGAVTITNSTLSGNEAPAQNNDNVHTKAFGGCIYGGTDVYLGASSVTDCFAGGHDSAIGGGVYAANTLTLAHATLAGNYAAGTDGSSGGGLFARSLVADYSTLHGNRVAAGPYGFSGFFEGGGAFIYKGSAQVSRSTIDGNNSVGAGGGLFALAASVTLDSSTVSNNVATSNGEVNFGAGGVEMSAPKTLHVSNSTIAFNTGSARSGYYVGAGIRAAGTVVIESSIIADNFTDDVASDLSCNCGTNASKTVSGANNLIMAVDPHGVQAPPGMIVSSADPHLVPLGDHGGETRTHALIVGSPALGLGNNLANFTTDQRGLGFARVVSGSADIGAYQRQAKDDELFYSGFQ